MSYKVNIGKGHIITNAELFCIDYCKAPQDVDLIEYDVLIDPLNIVNIIDVRVMWDTGANISCINSNLTNNYNLPILGDRKVRMANNEEVDAKRAFATMKLNDILGYTMQFASFELDQEVDVIIGLDIISQGSLVINYMDDKPYLEFMNQDTLKYNPFGNIVSLIKL